jgi:hypothetical protein
VVTVSERDRLPIDVGRSQRVVSSGSKRPMDM